MTICVYSKTITTPGAVQLKRVAALLGVPIIVSSFDTPEARKQLFASDIFIPRIAPSRRHTIQELIVEYGRKNPRGLLAVSNDCLEQSFDKYKAYKAFVAHKLPTPHTYLIEQLGDIQAQLLETKLPLVVKPVDENCGKGVSLVKTVADLQARVASLLEVYGSCIVQEFIRDAQGHDIRAFVVGDKVVAAMERHAPKGGFAANLAQGGIAQPVVLSEQDQALAAAAAKTFGAHFAGVDLIEGTRGKLVLEVNVSPGFKIVDVTGVDVPLLILRHLLHVYREGQYD